MPQTSFVPAYLQLPPGELPRRASLAYQHLKACDLCARNCGVDRWVAGKGVCRAGKRARVSSYGAHMGEEAPLRGWRGSGTIFFAGCNLRCQFCQNYTISQQRIGQDVSSKELARMMLELQARGCHNINFVSPSHVVSQILAALAIAVEKGLRLPLVYNTGGYDSQTALELLDGVVDIYMPDMKYSESGPAHRYSRVRDYPQINHDAVREMHRQVGDLQIGADGVARRGLLVRHLIIPHGLAGTAEIVRFLAEEISPHTYLNLMDQYYPAYRASRFAELDRAATGDEYRTAVRLAREAGLNRLDKRRA